MPQSENSKQPVILFVVPTAYVLGGVAVWLNYLLNGLEKKGMNVVLGLLDGDYHRAENYLEHYPFVNTIRILNESGTRYGRVRSIQRAIESVAPDIVFVVNTADAYEASDLVKKNGLNIKLVMTLHALEDDYFFDIIKYKALIDYVVVTNKLTKKLVAQLCEVDYRDVLYAPYGVISGETQRPKRIEKQVKQLNILYVGRIDEPQKRCSDLIQIVIELEARQVDYKLRIAGDGPARNAVLTALSDVCGKDKVEYLGVIKQIDIARLAYQTSDVLLITSSWETGPIVAWEAMTNGLAVVTSKYFGYEDEQALVDGQNCLLFDVGDAKSAADQLIKLQNVALLNSLIKSGIELVAQRYTEAHSIQSWYEAIMKIQQTEGRKNDVRYNAKQWPRQGRIESFFGHKYGHWIRRLLNKPAFKSCAGDEWPHSYAYESDDSESLLMPFKNKV